MTLTCYDIINTQKKILKQTSVSQAQYIQNVSSLNSTINNTNEGVKFNSYDRYLNKKKGKVLANQGKITSTALKGNKTQTGNNSLAVITLINCALPSCCKPNPAATKPIRPVSTGTTPNTQALVINAFLSCPFLVLNVLCQND